MLKNFIGTTPYHVNVNSVHAIFVRLTFVAAIDCFTSKISRFTVYNSQMIPTLTFMVEINFLTSFKLCSNPYNLCCVALVYYSLLG